MTPLTPVFSLYSENPRRSVYSRPIRRSVCTGLFGALFAILCMLQCSTALAFDCPSPRILDGDTIECGRAKVRIFGVDAPENGQSGGWESAQNLRALVQNQTLTCDERDIDRFGRTVAICYIGPVSIGAQMVENGWAWDFKKYSRGLYNANERRAREARRGIWANGEPVPPWRWRENKR